MFVHVLALVASLAGAPLTPPPEQPSAVASGPATIPLWPRGAPGAEQRSREPEIVENTYVRNVHSPSLTVFPAAPRHATGAAIIVVPGGGHRMLVFVNEGVGPAKALNRYGVTAFVLKYRLAREAGSTYAIDRDAASDLRRAIRWVRANAARYGVDPRRIGVMGFSAGGELVSLVADNPAPPQLASTDPLDAVSARPDFQVLVYPGPLGVPAGAVAGAPPAFITAGSLDQCCAEPAMTLYSQLRKAGVSAELHLFADMDHGFNIAAHSESLSILHWPDRLADWLSDGGWLHERPVTEPKPFKP
ncbi:alpha/beta hydrolase [Caulobacter sp.]|uniref:alpha/beta hydrolase n=1 Tax=Caulobacter sp. TaxID=78 RepID=UPI002B497D33|nr:alpha/beta hydrolase [Caulobacter sp.]HJV42271.1 alpha/beta hydrolase [Caulobacter sp.]